VLLASEGGRVDEEQQVGAGLGEHVLVPRSCAVLVGGHQLGAAAASVAAGVVRDVTGAYAIAWFGAAGLCVVAAVLSLAVTRACPAKPVEHEVVGV